MGTAAIFPHAAMAAGLYESFYLRTVSSSEPVGAWIRHTVHKPPGRPARGSVWCTVFDAARGRPFTHKLTTGDLHIPSQAWLDVAIGRVKVGRVSTPWIANGALSLDGRRYRIGGLGARGLRIDESPARCQLHLTGESGLALEADVGVPAETAAGWRYADPDGS